MKKIRFFNAAAAAAAKGHKTEFRRTIMLTIDAYRKAKFEKIMPNLRYRFGCAYYYQDVTPPYQVGQCCIVKDEDGITRTFVRITSIKVERLQDIEYDGMLAEGLYFSEQVRKAAKNGKYNKLYSDDDHGIVDFCDDVANDWWQSTWDNYGKDGYKWDDNPYVFVYGFEIIKEG